MNEETLKKAKGAKSAEELKSIAEGAGLTLTDEQVKEYYDKLSRSGELADEELDNVAGGGCHKGDGRLVVTVGYCCDRWTCKRCGSSSRSYFVDKSGAGYSHECGGNSRDTKCNNCKYMSYEGALWLCNHPANRG